MKKHLINIRPYHDTSYSWQELNCFIRPFALALNEDGGDEKTRKKYYSMFLMLVSLFMTHSEVDDSRIMYNGLHPMFQYIEKEISDAMGIRIGMEEYSSERKFHKKMKESLGAGYTVVVPCDLYGMPYSLNYLEQHHNHYMLVRGFDADRKIYHVLDNMHVEHGQSTAYMDFMVQYDIMYDMAELFHRYYDRGSLSVPYFWKIRSESKINDVVYNVKEYLCRIISGFVDGSIQTYYVERDMDGINTDFLGMARQVNMRNVYYGEMIHFACDICGAGSRDADNLEKLADEIKKKWNAVKLMIMKGTDNKQWKKILDDTIELEKTFHMNVLDALKDTETPFGNVKSAQTETVMFNPLEAAVVQGENGEYTVELSDSLVYDTWQVGDDAFQILDTIHDISGGYEYTCRFTDIDAVQGEAFHMGIIVKGRNGEKYLFGNSRGLHLVLFEPDKKYYELYQADKSFGEKVCFKMKITNNNGEFRYEFYVSEDKEWYPVMDVEDGFEPEYAGIFIKTWEKCSVKVTAGMKVVRI